MTTLFVTTQRARLHRDHGRVLVKSEGTILGQFPAHELDHVALLGNISLTAPAAALLLDRGIDLSYMTRAGRLLGILRAAKSPRATLVLAQVSAFHDADFVIAFVRRILTQKLQTQTELLRRWHDKDARASAKQIDQLAAKLQAADTVERIRGLEGAAARIYFAAMRSFISEPTFTARLRRPPPDPINALLSLGYSVILGELTGLLDAFGLVSSLGFLHQIRAGRPALALDLLEPLRAAVDRQVVTLWRERTLTPRDFREANGGLRLDRPALALYLTRLRDFWDAEPESWRTRLRRAATGARRAILHRDIALMETGDVESV